MCLSHLTHCSSITAVVLLFPQFATAWMVRSEEECTGDDRVEDRKGKTVLVVMSCPDDEITSCGGTLAPLAKNNNTIQVLIYTT